ncbi:MAG TPA: zinc-dependent metalloprotease, partial [Ilumatobacteraceae bacterium]
MPAPVDWKRAEQVALKVAARHPQPNDTSIQTYDFAALTRVAEDRVEACTGLRSLAGPAHVQVIDRADWIRANISSFQALLDPLLNKIADGKRVAGLSARARAATAQVAGAEAGLMLGWMSGRVLGQYDLLYGESDDASDEGAVYLVGPNMVMLEDKFGFEPEQFRLWVTLHELTHRAQFTGVSWMRPHFLELLHRTLDLAEPDPARISAALRDALHDRTAAKQRLRDGGIVAVVASPEQQAVFRQTAGLMSLLEGHGDVVM